MPPHVFAVDGVSLRYGRLSRVDGRFELDEYRTASLDRDLFSAGPLGGPMHDPERFRATLTGLLQSVSGPVERASLILPDSWLRLAIVEGDELPRSTAAREEILRWKLQRTVPFRVEELRIRGLETHGPGGKKGTRRVLLGFAVETLVQQIEASFADRGIHLGFVSNESLSLLTGLRHALRDTELGVLVFVSRVGYSLTFVLRGEPILHRFKALPQLSQDEPPRELMRRDLHLTNSYVREQIDGGTIGRILWIGPSELEERWGELLTEAFDLPVHAVRAEHVPLAIAAPDVPPTEALAMLGAASQVIR